MLELFSRTDIWVVDALRERPHPTHIHLGATLDAILAVQPGQAILTHMDHSMDYASLCTTLPTAVAPGYDGMIATLRSEEHTSELQSLMRISYAVFCLKKKKQYRQRLMITA